MRKIDSLPDSVALAAGEGQEEEDQAEGGEMRHCGLFGSDWLPLTPGLINNQIN